MFKINDYVVYKRDVCKIINIIKKYFKNQDYYVLVPISDNSLKEYVPISNDNGYLRNLITYDQMQDIINSIPSIKELDTPNKLIENDYKKLLESGTHEDLIKIIKTTYLRNKERTDNNKKTGDKDSDYFKKSERYLYNEFSLVLNKTYEETQQYVFDRVKNIDS